MSQLGQMLRKKREDLGMSIEELSDKTMIAVNVLADIESGLFEKYCGDEMYVKMYLRRISFVLDVDIDDVTEQYNTLTMEISQAKLNQEIEESQKKGKKTKIKTPKNYNPKKPSPMMVKKAVYNNNPYTSLFRTVVILVLICAILTVVWYGIALTKTPQKDPTFKDPNQSTIQGEVPNKDEDNQDETKDPVIDNQELTITRNDVLDFSFTLPTHATEFTFKVEYVTASWAKLYVNGSEYSDFESRIYNEALSSDPEVVEITFKVDEFESLSLRNGFNLRHRYYINGQEVPLTDEDSFRDPAYFNLKLIKDTGEQNTNEPTE